MNNPPVSDIVTRAASRRFAAASFIAASTAALLAGCSTPADPDTTPGIAMSSPATDDEEADGDVVTSYRDGRYSATGWYGGAPSHHDVTLTIEDHRITGVEITTPAENPTSLEYQRAFAAALPDAIVGRAVDDVQIDRIAGASGSPDGFMDALEQIKGDAAN